MQTLSSGRWLNESENKGINIITSKIHIESSTMCYIWRWNFFHLYSYIKSLENYLRRIVVLTFCIKANFIQSSVLMLFINRIKQHKQFNLEGFLSSLWRFVGFFLLFSKKLQDHLEQFSYFPLGWVYGDNIRIFNGNWATFVFL